MTVRTPFRTRFRGPVLTLPQGMSHLSTSLRSESEKYRRAARNINIQAMIRQYLPIGAVVLLIIIFVYWRVS